MSSIHTCEVEWSTDGFKLLGLLFFLVFAKDDSKISTYTATPSVGSQGIKMLVLYWQRIFCNITNPWYIMITFSLLFYLLFTQWEFADLGRSCKWIVSEVSVVETCSKLAQEFLPSTSSFHIQHVYRWTTCKLSVGSTGDTGDLWKFVAPFGWNTWKYLKVQTLERKVATYLIGEFMKSEHLPGLFWEGHWSCLALMKQKKCHYVL